MFAFCEYDRVLLLLGKLHSNKGLLVDAREGNIT